jgi:hypothetical protein
MICMSVSRISWVACESGPAYFFSVSERLSYSSSIVQLIPFQIVDHPPHPLQVGL